MNFGGVTVQALLQSTEVIRATAKAGVDFDYNVEILAGHGPNGTPVAGSVSVGDEIVWMFECRAVGYIFGSFSVICGANSRSTRIRCAHWTMLGAR